MTKKKTPVLILPGRNVVQEAADIIAERSSVEVYGPISESFDKIAKLSNLIFTSEELEDGEMTAEKIAKVMIAVKQIRGTYSPENPEHTRDTIGYFGCLDKIRLGQ